MFKGAPPPDGPAETLVLQGDKLEPETAPKTTGTSSGDLAGAHELYRRGEFAQAEKLFHKVANNTKNSISVAEEARYYEAECLRRQGRYPKSADTYAKVCNDFPSGAYRDQAVQHMFDIANFWLDDTREQMEAYKEKNEGKRWYVGGAWVHFDKSKPFFDEEGRAIEKLEQVTYNDMTGPLADRCLFLAGSVKFFREDYREADHYFTQIAERHPNSPFATQALELAIISKHLSTGGSDYDGKKVAEARALVDKALRNYPELANQKRDFLERQLVGITLQQAEKDFKMAEFYRRTGHPGSAYFYYEIVRRRYPGTKFFDMATEKMHELREEAEKKDKDKQVPPVPDPGKAPVASAKPEQGPMPRTLPPQPEVAPPPRTLPPQPEVAPPPRTLPPQPEAAPPPRTVPPASN
jgi:outer membrane protein assembly factor BamD (BamD/ComL family)